MSIHVKDESLWCNKELLQHKKGTEIENWAKGMKEEQPRRLRWLDWSEEEGK